MAEPRPSEPRPSASLGIWIARPEPGASRTAERVAAMGFEPVVAPVLTVRPTGAGIPAAGYAGLLLTSAHAVSALASGGGLSALCGTPVFTVGARTAAMAAQAGLGPVHDAGGDAAALVRLVLSRLPAGAALLHAAGAERKAEPAAALRAAGLRLTTVVVYEAAPVEALPDAVRARLMRAGGLHGALHYSRRSAATALRLADAADLGGRFRGLRHLCLSRDVALPLEQAGVPIHFVSALPNEDDLLAGLAEGL